MWCINFSKSSVEHCITSGRSDTLARSFEFSRTPPYAGYWNVRILGQPLDIGAIRYLNRYRHMFSVIQRKHNEGLSPPIEVMRAIDKPYAELASSYAGCLANPRGAGPGLKAVTTRWVSGVLEAIEEHTSLQYKDRLLGNLRTTRHVNDLCLTSDTFRAIMTMFLYRCVYSQHAFAMNFMHDPQVLPRNRLRPFDRHDPQVSVLNFTKLRSPRDISYNTL
jgi:hypothetical protein